MRFAYDKSAGGYSLVVKSDLEQRANMQSIVPDSWTITSGSSERPGGPNGAD